MDEEKFKYRIQVIDSKGQIEKAETFYEDDDGNGNRKSITLLPSEKAGLKAALKEKNKAERHAAFDVFLFSILESRGIKADEYDLTKRTTIMGNYESRRDEGGKLIIEG
jgi:hypothetical protein